MDRKTIRILLGALDIEQRALAELMGYRPAYVANVLNGQTPASAAFRQAFGDALAELLLGHPDPAPDRYPAEPLWEIVRRRAAAAESRSRFYDDLGISVHSLSNRDVLPGALVDRLCCALGVHPTSIYGPNDELEDES